MNTQLLNRLKRIKALYLDVDGVLTSGSISYSSDQTEQKSFNVKDGFGIKLLQSQQIDVGIITARNSLALEKRMHDLAIKKFAQGTTDKLKTLRQLANSDDLQHIAYMGDDWPDYSVLQHVGVALCPKDAHAEIKTISHWQSQFSGGQGAVREACDLILRAQGKYDACLKNFSSP